jgi:hypothetical protein
MKTFSGYKMDKRVYYYIFLLILAYSIAYFIGIKDVDFSLFIGVVIFGISFSIIFSFNETYNKVVFFEESLTLTVNESGKRMDTRIYYEDIIRIGKREEKWQYTHYIITNEEEYQLGCNVNDITGFYNAIYSLKSKGIDVDDNILELMLKNYILGTRKARPCLSTVFILLTMLSWVFFNLNVLLWFGGLVLGFVLLVYFNINESKLKRKRNSMLEVSTLEEKSKRLERIAFRVSTIAFSYQVLITILSIFIA